MPADYESTARGLSLPISEAREEADANHDPRWRRFPLHSSSAITSNVDNWQQPHENLRQTAINAISNVTGILQQAGGLYFSLSLLQKIIIAATGIIGIAALTVLLIYRESVFAWIAPIAAGWRDIPFGWAILWTATFVVSFPPMIGYSTCILLSGLVFGIWKGWLIVASATVLGSLASFVVSRTLLSNFVHKLVAHDRRFTALALTLKNGGITCLIMIRLCPLPYSLSNGAMSTVPTVGPLNFFIAAAAATPKLLIHTFIGNRLAALSNDLGDMDRGTKILNYLSIALGLTFGFMTAWFVYRQTKRRAAQLETPDEDVGEVFDDDADEELDRGEWDQNSRPSSDFKSTASSRPGVPYVDEPSWEDPPIRPITFRVARSSVDEYQDSTVTGNIAGLNHSMKG